LANDKELILPKRWFPLPEKVKRHPVIRRLRQKETQYTVVAAGRRSFKTESAKRHTMAEALSTANQRLFLAAPTHRQAKDIYWQDILDLVPKHEIKKVDNTNLILTLQNNTQICVVGLEAHKRIEGIMWHGGVVSEYQDVSREFFPHTLQPILTDTNGWCWFEGRPTGLDILYDYSLKEKTNPDRWRFLTWKSEDILTPEQIQQAKEELDEITYRQEYEASFEANASRAYYAFTDQYHDKEYESTYPLFCTCDFNVSTKPMTWSVGQEIEGTTYWLQTFAYTHTNTFDMCVVLHDWLKEKGVGYVCFYGDYSGSHPSSNSTVSDWELIESYFRSTGIRTDKRIQPTVTIRDRVAATNSRLRSSTGTVRQYIHRTKCKAIEEDFLRVVWKDNGVRLDDSNDNLTHASDGVSYYNMVEYPIYGKQVSVRLS
jgi:hypothetical protein